MKLALSTTLSGSTPRCSTTIFLTRSATSLISSFPSCVGLPTRRVDNPKVDPSSGRQPLFDRPLRSSPGGSSFSRIPVTPTHEISPGRPSRVRRQTGSIAYLDHQGERADRVAAVNVDMTQPFQII